MIVPVSCDTVYCFDMGAYWHLLAMNPNLLDAIAQGPSAVTLCLVPHEEQSVLRIGQAVFEVVLIAEATTSTRCGDSHWGRGCRSPSRAWRDSKLILAAGTLILVAIILLTIYGVLRPAEQHLEGIVTGILE